MKRYHALIVLCLLLTCSVTASVVSYRQQQSYIRSDVRRALALTLEEKTTDRVDADTIRTYRSHITIAAVRDTACIRVRTIRRSRGDVTYMEAEPGCSFATVFRMSDQRVPALLGLLSLLWALSNMQLLFRRRFPQGCPAIQLAPVASSKAWPTMGNLSFNEDEDYFCTPAGDRLRLTPMQQQLMALFFRTSTHRLSKESICQALWPGKPDASETLYTLVRRLKPTLHSHGLTLSSDRGRGYELTLVGQMSDKCQPDSSTD